MSDQCDHNCDSCDENCNEREMIQKEHTNEYSQIKKVIAIVSGKGGVGKSSVTSLIASGVRKKGYRTAVLDADITGPSIPKAFGITKKVVGNELGILPLKSSTGISIMSVNFFLENDTDPVVWRGPILGNTVKQFWTDVIWDRVDYLFIDMPPGTGDVPLTVFQSLPIDGIIIVTSPQELVSMIVSKAIKMAEIMNIPVLGLVENMSYFECPDTHKKYQIFGESHIDEIAKSRNLKVLAKLPIDPEISRLCDQGLIEEYQSEEINELIEKIEEKGE